MTSQSATSANLATLHRQARRRLAEAGVDNATLDARLLVEHFSETTRTQAIVEPERTIEAGAVAAIESALKRRIGGEPVHRILGFREFYGLRLALSPETLEPRPDTETLVDTLIPRVRTMVAREGGCRILDLGTGTGAIALALLSAVPGSTALGVDISTDALATAAQNAEQLGLAERFATLRSDWFCGISGHYHVIASNPPYIPSKDIDTLQADVRDFDPLRALDGGRDGLDAYRIIAGGAGPHLEADGIVAVEIGSTQKTDVTTVFEKAGFALAEALRDLAGHDRVLVFAAREKA